MTSKPKDLNANEGEGSTSAGREYDDAATKFARSGKAEGAAKSAREFVDQNPEAAADAERAGKLPLATPEK